MKIVVIIFVFVLTNTDALVAQGNETARIYGDQLSPGDLKEYLSILASDALEGRKAGSRGQKMAAAFISAHFQEIGLAPVNGSYYQQIDLYSVSPPEVYIKAGTTRFENFEEFFYAGSSGTSGELQADIVFAGKGTENDYAQVDVKNKAVALLIGPLASIGALRAVVQRALEKGASMVFVASESSPEEFHNFAGQRKEFFSSGSLSLKKPEMDSSNKGIFIINHPVVEKLFNITFDKLKKAAAEDPRKKALSRIKPGKVTFRVEVTLSTVKTENVLGYLEGSEKKDELVVVTAHFDHIGLSASGEDRINNGADDDGSGTVSVLEMAKLFAKAKKEGHGPRRSMLFITFTAEELGLFGSQYYVEHPLFPLSNTVVDLNIDMVGRIDPEHKDRPNYVYVIGSDKLSTELHQLNEKANATYTKLDFDYTYNDENHPSNLYKRSDHWNFAKNGVPIIFYFDGIHEDYHRPSDEISKINFELLAKRARCVFQTAWEIANREERITVDRKQN